jgi:hypothetical protein
VPTFYEILGVPPSASAREVRRAYLDQARRLHPDASDAADERAMQVVNEAWFVLRDPGRRARYDTELAGDEPAAPRAPRHEEPVAAAFLFEEPPPATPGPARSTDAVVLMPAALVVSGIGLLVFSTMTMSGPLLGLAFAVLLLGGAAFLVAPFLSLARHRRHR